jgi:hypothetical protein
MLHTLGLTVSRCYRAMIVKSFIDLESGVLLARNLYNAGLQADKFQACSPPLPFSYAHSFPVVMPAHHIDQLPYIFSAAGNRITLAGYLPPGAGLMTR